MRYVWLAFLLVVVLLVGRAIWLRLPEAETRTAVAPLTPARPTAYVAPAPALPATAPAASVPVAELAERLKPTALAAARSLAPITKADSVVAFALHQIGTNYCYAGVTPEGGFDCSGFVLYVFARYGVATPHSTAMLIDVGRPVPRADARPGDIVVFTGTAATSTTPGHAGIIISQPGEPIRFVHSSSARREPGVKISQVEGSGYERRFMQVRRIL